MPREQQYSSPAERQAAYRARKQAELEQVPEQPVAQADELEQNSTAAMDAYVEREVAITRSQIEQGLIKTVAVGPDGETRLDPVGRTRAYAQWRWRGYHAGEIASL